MTSYVAVCIYYHDDLIVYRSTEGFALSSWTDPAEKHRGSAALFSRVGTMPNYDREHVQSVSALVLTALVFLDCKL